MKTPEEMAEEYRKAWGDEQLYKIRHEHKRFEWSDALVDGFLAGYQAAKDETNLPTPAKWISVKDRLPEFCKTIVAYGPRIYCVISQLMQDEEGYSYVGPYMSVHPDEVTHWCEVPELPKLPAPPKEEK